MTNPVVESHIRDVLHSVADTTHVEDRWSEIGTAPTPAPNRRRHPLQVAVAGFVVTLMIVGMATLLPSLVDRSRGGDLADSLPSGRYPMASFVPHGFEPISRSPIDRTLPSIPPAVTWVLANDAVPSGSITGIVLVSFLQTPWEPQPEDPRIEHRGMELALYEPAGSASVMLVWEQDGVVAMLHGWDLDLTEALAVVDGVSVTGDDPTVAGAVDVQAPEGRKVISGPEIVEITPATWLTLAPLGTPLDAGDTSINIQVRTSSVENSLGHHATAEPLTVRDRDGYLATRTDVLSVIWQEQPGMTITVEGRNVTRTDLIKVAEGLSFVEVAPWHGEYGDVDDGMDDGLGDGSKDIADPVDPSTN